MVFNEHVKIREEKFGSVIFETLKEKIFVTNQTGKEILALLQQNKSLGEIVNILVGSYNSQPDDIRNDVISFIALLKDNALITQ